MNQSILSSSRFKPLARNLQCWCVVSRVPALSSSRYGYPQDDKRCRSLYRGRDEVGTSCWSKGESREDYEQVWDLCWVPSAWRMAGGMIMNHRNVTVNGVSFGLAPPPRVGKHCLKLGAKSSGPDGCRWDMYFFLEYREENYRMDVKRRGRGGRLCTHAGNIYMRLN